MNDPELESWGQAWRQQPAVLADLRARTVREHRRLVAWVAIDVLGCIALGALSAGLLVKAGDAARQLAGVGMAIITVACSVFLALNWRGSFTRVADSAREHLALQRRRALARLNYARFSWVILALQLLLLAGILWLRMHAEPPHPPKPAALAVLGIAFVVAAGVTHWLQRGARRRLASIEALSRTLEEA